MILLLRLGVAAVEPWPTVFGRNVHRGVLDADGVCAKDPAGGLATVHAVERAAECDELAYAARHTALKRLDESLLSGLTRRPAIDHLRVMSTLVLI